MKQTDEHATIPLSVQTAHSATCMTIGLSAQGLSAQGHTDWGQLHKTGPVKAQALPWEHSLSEQGQAATMDITTRPPNEASKRTGANQD